MREKNKWILRLNQQFLFIKDITYTDMKKKKKSSKKLIFSPATVKNRYKNLMPYYFKNMCFISNRDITMTTSNFPYCVEL